jgi:hypothetical protein
LDTKAKRLIKTDAFQYIVISAVFAATVVVGLQTYPEFENNRSILVIDILIASIFGLEIIVKLVAVGFREYFTGHDWRWNNFDFFVVVGCIIGFFPGVFSSATALPILRLFRLLRVAKLMDKFPQLRMVILGLMGGVASMGYITALLFLVMFVFACTGVIAFRCAHTCLCVHTSANICCYL